MNIFGILLILLSVFCYYNGVSAQTTEAAAVIKDCAGVLGGKAYMNSCGFCIKPSEPVNPSYPDPNLGVDCRGTCFGTYHIIANGSCVDSVTPEMRARDEERRRQQYISDQKYQAKHRFDGLRFFAGLFFPPLMIFGNR